MANKRKPNGYWTLENTLKECKKVILKEKKFPTQTRLVELKLSGLAAAIQTHGGMHEIRNQLGLKDEASERPKNYWTKERAIEKYKELTDKLGHPPSSTELGKKDLNGLDWVISHKYGGYYAIRKKVGAESYRRDGYWTSKRVLKACSELVRERGDLPGQNELTKLAREDKKYRGLTTGIGRFGGLRAVRNSLKLEQRAREDHYWTKKKTKEEAQAVVSELGYLPTQKKLNEIGRSDLARAIGLSFGFPKLRKILGLKRTRVENNFWTESEILKECRKVIRQEGNLPASSRIYQIGYGALASQIQRHGGYPYFRSLLGLEQKVKEQGFWKNEENVLEEARKVMKECDLIKLPSQKGLGDLGYSGLAAAIQKTPWRIYSFPRDTRWTCRHKIRNRKTRRSIRYLRRRIK